MTPPPARCNVDGGAELVELPVQPPAAAVIRRSFEGRVSESGNLIAGTLTESWSGTEAARVRAYYAGKTAEERERDVLVDLQDRFTGARVESYEIEGLEGTNQAVTETSVIRDGRFGKRVADLLILEPGGVGYGVVQLRLPPPPRKWPLRPGNPRREELEVVLEMPSDWTVEELPEPFGLESEDLRAHGEWAVDGAKLIYRRDAELLSLEISPERYEAFRDDLAALDRADRQAVVLVTRDTATAARD